MTNKILVTGGTGFIGSYLVREMLKGGMDFVVLANRNTGFAPPANMERASLLDKEGLREVFKRRRPDAVIHLAAIATAVYSETSDFYTVNACGTENLLEAAQESCRPGTLIVLASTAGVYGNQDVDFLHEGLPFNPCNHYSCSKMVMEVLSRNYSGGLDIKIVRPFNVIGSGQKENFLVPKLVRAFALAQETIALGNVASVRDYVPADFCVKVLLKIVRQKELCPNILNICYGGAHSCLDLIDVLKDLTGLSPKIEIAESFVRKNEVKRMVGDGTRLAKFIGGEKKETVRETLAQMLSAACSIAARRKYI
ncbi:MAG: GDP-mannose 4,6-dehydratase [Acidaminococcales bacterium]|jgi:nucleoside-diphosphate-sugar epimerase|nr:GDP-mannose 4,6-dehydratase [Acidaminococcales bacterium]